VPVTVRFVPIRIPLTKLLVPVTVIPSRKTLAPLTTIPLSKTELPLTPRSPLTVRLSPIIKSSSTNRSWNVPVVNKALVPVTVCPEMVAPDKVFARTVKPVTVPAKPPLAAVIS
jgi:hypothetical protein